MPVTLDIPNPYKAGPIFHVTPYRLFGAGPINPSPSVMASLLLPTITGFNQNFLRLTKDIMTMMKYLYQTKNPMTFVAQLPGNGGNEAMVTNLADPGDTILIAVAGVWGQRFAEMGKRYNLNVVEMHVVPGEVFSLNDIEAQIVKHKPVTLFVTHGESTGGTLQPLEGLGEMCHKYDCLLAVDAVVSVGVVPILVDRWQIDAVNGGTQKGVGAFPGMILLTFSPRAHERMLKKKHPSPYLLDMIMHSNVWHCFGGQKPAYLYTFNSAVLIATRQALVEICQEGIENVWERHQQCADLFVNKIEKLGLHPFVEKREIRFPGVVCVRFPDGVDPRELLEYILSEHKLELGVGIGPTLGKAFRIGFMAQSARPAMVDMVVQALADDVPNPYQSGPNFRLTPFRLFGAGPTNPSPAVLNSLVLPPITAFSESYFRMTEDIKRFLRYVYQTNNAMTFAAQLPGNGGNEALVTNLADPGDTVLVAVAGVWGQKVADMGRRYNLNVVELHLAPGEVYSVKYLEEEIIKHKPVTLFVTHGESSGGTLQPLEGLGVMCHRHNCLLAVDAVISVGVVPLFVDRWQIDAVNGVTQKGIGGFPGTVLVSFSSRAHERMVKKKQPPPYMLDMIIHSRVWQCFDNKKVEYIYTFNSTMLVTTRQALAEICQEGIEHVWQRHAECAQMFYEKIQNLGMRHFVEKPENRFWGVIAVIPPVDVDSDELLEYLSSKHETEVGAGIGPTLGKSIRVGFLAQNAQPHLVDLIVNVLQDGIKYCRSNNKTPRNEWKSFVFYNMK